MSFSLSAVSHNQGMSLVELVVSIAVLSILMLIIVRTFLSSVTTNERLKEYSRLKQQGDLILNQLDSSVRDANSIATCTANTLTILNKNSTTNTFTAQAFTGSIPVNGSTTYNRLVNNPNQFLTSEGIVSDVGPTFSCTIDASSTYRLVNTSFTLKSYDPVPVSQSFTSTVGLRKY